MERDIDLWLRDVTRVGCQLKFCHAHSPSLSLLLLQPLFTPPIPPKPPQAVLPLCHRHLPSCMCSASFPSFILTFSPPSASPYPPNIQARPSIMRSLLAPAPSPPFFPCLSLHFPRYPLPSCFPFPFPIFPVSFLSLSPSLVFSQFLSLLPYFFSVLSLYISLSIIFPWYFFLSLQSRFFPWPVCLYLVCTSFCSPYLFSVPSPCLSTPVPSLRTNLSSIQYVAFPSHPHLHTEVVVIMVVEVLGEENHLKKGEG